MRDNEAFKDWVKSCIPQTKHDAYSSLLYDDDVFYDVMRGLIRVPPKKDTRPKCAYLTKPYKKLVDYGKDVIELINSKLQMQSTFATLKPSKSSFDDAIHTAMAELITLCNIAQYVFGVRSKHYQADIYPEGKEQVL